MIEPLWGPDEVAHRLNCTRRALERYAQCRSRTETGPSRGDAREERSASALSEMEVYHDRGLDRRGLGVRKPFGKYKGVALEQIRPDYLIWVLDNVDDLSPTLRRAIEDVLELRSLKPTPQLATSDARGLIKSWYRHASTKYHPDHGGSHEKQIVVNGCYETLIRGIEHVERSGGGA